MQRIGIVLRINNLLYSIFPVFEKVGALEDSRKEENVTT